MTNDQATGLAWAALDSWGMNRQSWPQYEEVSVSASLCQMPSTVARYRFRCMWEVTFRGWSARASDVFLASVLIDDNDPSKAWVRR